MTMLRRLLVALVLLVAASPALAAESYTSAQSVRDKGVDALIGKMGESRPVVRLTFAPDEIVAVTQADAGSDFVQWTVSRLDLGIVNFHVVSGPSPTYESGVVDDPSGAYFRLSEIDLGRFDAVVEASIAHAGLEEAPEAVSVEIARTVSILPVAAYGDIRWTVALKTAEESASVYLTRDGEVLGADLSNTKRAKDLDLLVDDDWPMAEAQAALEGVLGSSAVHEVRLYTDYVMVTADHPTDSELQRDYIWRLGGVTRGLMDTPNLVNLGMGGVVAFPFSEVDLTRLPQIKAAAREAFESPEAAIIAMSASKPTDIAIGELKVLWEVAFRDPSGEEGDVQIGRAHV